MVVVHGSWDLVHLDYMFRILLFYCKPVMVEYIIYCVKLHKVTLVHFLLSTPLHCIRKGDQDWSYLLPT